jgi:multisubunit Na+/H+ antiporter MnhB subunit
LGTCVASFVLFALTTEERYKRFGLRVLKWTVLVGLGFFAILFGSQLAGI